MKAGPAALSCSRPIGMMGPQVQEECRESGDFFTELLARRCGRPSPGKEQGFGSRLERGLASALGAEILRDWRATGLSVSIRMPSATAIDIYR